MFQKGNVSLGAGGRPQHLYLCIYFIVLRRKRHKLLTPKDVAELTGLPYAKALTLVKAMAYKRIERRYYVSEKILMDFLSQEEAVEIKNES